MKENSLPKANAPQIFIVFLDKWDLIICNFFSIGQGLLWPGTQRKRVGGIEEGIESELEMYLLMEGWPMLGSW